MSADGDDSPSSGGREVAYRLFAAEFDDADFDYSESDEERAPNYVVTPTGARANRVFAVGVLTEVQPAGEDILRARIADPTGTFVVYAGQYQPDAQTFLERAEPPAYVAVTGKARTFRPDDGDAVYTSIRPESLNEVDEDTRDRWSVETARQTLERVGTMAAAMQSDASGEDLTASLRQRGVSDGLASGIPLALAHYGTTPGYLAAVRELAISAAELVAGEREEVEPLGLAPAEGGDADLDALAATADLGDAAVPGTGDAESTAETPEASESAGVGSGTATTDSAATGSGAETVESTAEPTADLGSTNEPDTRSTEEPDTGVDTTTSNDARAGTNGPSAVGGEDAGETGGVTPEGEEPTDDSTAQRDGEPGETVETGTDSASTEEASGAEEPGTTPSTDETPGMEDSATAPSTEETAGGSESGDIGDFDGEFELDEDEREEIKSEFGTEFSSGTEVEEPGEADIDTPDPADLEEETPAAEASIPSDSPDDEPVEAAPDEPDEAESADSDDAGAESAEIDLEDAVMAAMTDLDDGDGADRAAVVGRVSDEHGVDSEAVEDAIQEALMNGRCYEPGEGTLKPI